MRRISVFLFLLCTTLFFGALGFATAQSDLFAKYPNEIFIETGTYFGEGVEAALRCGFKKVFSIELSPKYFQFAKKKFAKYPNVYLYEGDSGIVLKHVLDNITKRATFWLDGHWSNGDTAYGESITPIMRELEIIKKHHIKTHTILIDDVRCFDVPAFDNIKLADVFEKLKEINPNYKFCYENGIVENDILVAYVD